MTKITPQPGILDIALYQGGASSIEGIANVVKLSSNENPFGPSEDAKKAYQKLAFELHRYPSSDHRALRAALGDICGLDAERVICGAGSDEIISFLCQAYAGPGDEVIHTEHGFAMYRIRAGRRGDARRGARARARDRCGRDPRGLHSAHEACLSGQPQQSHRHHGRRSRDRPAGARAAPQALLVVDGAYAEYVEGYDGGAHWSMRARTW